jgi:hypothetical protein
MAVPKPLPPHQEPAENLPVKEFLIDVEEDVSSEPDGQEANDVEQDS